MSLNEKSLERLIREAVEKQLNGNLSSKANSYTGYKNRKIPIGVSARHLHITQEHLEILFGKGATLTPKKELIGGEFAAEERVTLVGTNLRVIENVRILGPVRDYTQVELSKTDARSLGINPPIRESGNLEGSAPICIVGPKGAVYLDEGCIIAKRHIHMNEEDAKFYGLKNNDIVSVEVEGERASILHHVQIKVSPQYELQMHVDTDEANGLGASCGSFATIIKE